jgi:hypothetical protein
LESLNHFTLPVAICTSLLKIGRHPESLVFKKPSVNPAENRKSNA